ncbi:hypothetical protein BGZ90_011069 [Linnemannia elongata]|nr:hypothetical protein BGZ90_011069 [Linnemannia elongata]
MVLWYKGLWDVAAYYLARSIGYSARVFTMPFGIDMGMLLPVLFGVFMAQMFLRRYKKEEMMLREHFGKEWDEYAREPITNKRVLNIVELGLIM